jgi:hypothetical protein
MEIAKKNWNGREIKGRSFGDNTYQSSGSICGKNDDYHLKVSITKRSSVLAISRKFHVAYQTKRRHGVANYLSTGEEISGLAKDGKMKMLPFYAEGDRKQA